MDDENGGKDTGGGRVQAVQAPPAAPPLQGVGGWLKFLVFSMGVLSPLFMLLDFLRADSEWDGGKAFYLLVTLVIMAFFVLAAWRLYSRHVWASVRFAIRVLWIGSLGIPLFVYATILLFFGWDVLMAAVGAAVAETVRSLVYPTVWTLYLLRSVRVKNTYRRESSLEELAGNFGVGR